MHAIKNTNNVCFFHFVTAPNEDDHYDACKIGKIHQELQKDSLTVKSFSASLQSNSLLSPPLCPSYSPFYLILDHSKSQL